MYISELPYPLRPLKKDKKGTNYTILTVQNYEEIKDGKNKDKTCMICANPIMCVHSFLVAKLLFDYMSVAINTYC